jgi:hypothetical protein
MGRILDATVAYLREDRWRFHQVNDKPIVVLHVLTQSRLLICVAQAHEAEEQLDFSALLPPVIPEGRRRAVAEFVTRANGHLAPGAFDFDPDDGIVLCKASIDVRGTRLTAELIRPLLHHVITAAERHLPALLAVAFGRVKPTDALDRVGWYSLDQTVRWASEILDDNRCRAREGSWLMPPTNGSERHM